MKGGKGTLGIVEKFWGRGGGGVNPWECDASYVSLIHLCFRRGDVSSSRSGATLPLGFYVGANRYLFIGGSIQKYVCISLIDI